MTQKEKSNFSTWLEGLQQESWQLELLLSGFAIFLLIGAYEPLQSLTFTVFEFQGSIFASLILPYFILFAAWYVMVINLILHVVLRGLWISAIGLRYVAGSINFESFGFKGPFETFLRKKDISLDRYIESLEEICSLIFAFTFLVILLMLSFGLFNAIAIILSSLGAFLFESMGYHDSNFKFALTNLWTIGGAICAIDFLGMGWMRRHKTLSRFYFPIYKIYSTATLTFTYRSLYYNLIDGKFGWKGLIFLMIYIGSILIMNNLGFRVSGYIPDNPYSQTFHNYYYDDTWSADTPSGRASIPSYHINNGYLEVFLPYNANDDDRVIRNLCPTLEPLSKGVQWEGLLSPGTNANLAIDVDSVLTCNEKRFKFFVNDSLHTDVQFKIRQHPIRKRKGFFTILDVDYLPRGRHELRLHVYLPRPAGDPDPFGFVENDVIPFWVE